MRTLGESKERPLKNVKMGDLKSQWSVSHLHTMSPASLRGSLGLFSTH